MILVRTCGVISPVCAPRICGDDPSRDARLGIMDVCSPHLRG